MYRSAWMSTTTVIFMFGELCVSGSFWRKKKSVVDFRSALWNETVMYLIWAIYIKAYLLNLMYYLIGLRKQKYSGQYWKIGWARVHIKIYIALHVNLISIGKICILLKRHIDQCFHFSINIHSSFYYGY